MRTSSFFAICSRVTVCSGLKNTACRGAFARRLPDHMTGLRVPELQPQSQRRHPVSHQLDTRRFELIEYLFAELCKPRQQHVLRAEPRPKRRSCCRSSIPFRAKPARISAYSVANPLSVRRFRVSRVEISRIGGLTSASAPLSACDMVGLSPCRVAGARMPAPPPAYGPDPLDREMQASVSRWHTYPPDRADHSRRAALPCPQQRADSMASIERVCPTVIRSEC